MCNRVLTTYPLNVLLEWYEDDMLGFCAVLYDREVDPKVEA